MALKNKRELAKQVEEAKAALWERGELTSWVLDANQQSIVSFIKENKARQICVIAARQIGKSFTMLTYAIEECFKNKNYIVTMVAPSAKQAREIAKNTMQQILESCPKELRPEYKTQENIFKFHNGSQIQIYGNNKGHVDSIRGGRSHLVICDEVGFWDDMTKSIRGVLFPRLNSTKGKLVVISTPPTSAGHPFQQYYIDADYRKAAIIKTIFDSPRYSQEDIDEFADELGGYDSIEFRREYLCEFLVDRNLQVIPEATDELMDQITREWKKPPFFDSYVSVDFGLKDLTAMLFAYYDFRLNKIVIEDEIIIKDLEKLRLDKIAETMKDKENELWGFSEDDEYTPYMRIVDAPPLVINDLYLQHNLPVNQASRHDLDAAISNTRLMLQSNRVIISPKCENLIFQLKNAVWKNEKRKEIDRSPDAGHYDAVMALVYLLNNVHYNRNPYPSNYDLHITQDTFYGRNFNQYGNSYKEQMKNIFAPKKKG